MKKLPMLVSLILLLLIPSVYAQRILLTIPETRPAITELKLSKTNIDFKTNTAFISIGAETATGEIVRYYEIIIPNAVRGTTFTALLSAIGTTRIGESGNAEARANFRILGYLRDSGYPELLAGTLQ